MESKKENPFKKYVINNPGGYFDVLKKKDFWKKLAEEKNADFKIITTVSMVINKIRIRHLYKKNLIVITESDTQPLFIETTLNLWTNRDSYFEITENAFIERILNKISNKSVNLNNAEFDKKFLIKTM